MDQDLRPGPPFKVANRQPHIDKPPLSVQLLLQQNTHAIINAHSKRPHRKAKCLISLNQPSICEKMQKETPPILGIEPRAARHSASDVSHYTISDIG
ncbi:hypothetical protein V8C26DRAFT_408556, partial [Trichoderma gracile]